MAPRPHAKTLDEAKDRAWRYLSPAVNKTRYVYWRSGVVPPRSPAWAENGPPPRIQDVVRDGAFCAAVATLIRRELGLEVPHLGDENFDGGVVAYVGATNPAPRDWARQGYFARRGVLKDFDLAEAKRRPWTLLLRRYRDVSDQGHVAVSFPGGRVLQTYDGGNGWPGLNTDATIERSHAGGYYEFMVAPEDWLLPKGASPGPGGGDDAVAIIDRHLRGNGSAIVEAARRTGLDLALACALVDHESIGGQNIFGCDWGARWTEEPPYCQVPVTPERVRALLANIENGGGQNGVGLTQLTSVGYVRQAEALGGAHIPLNQCLVGFEVLKGHIDRFGYARGIGAYNAGAGNPELGIDNGYYAKVRARHDVWKQRLAGVGAKPARPRLKPNLVAVGQLDEEAMHAAALVFRRRGFDVTSTRGEDGVSAFDGIFGTEPLGTRQMVVIGGPALRALAPASRAWVYNPPKLDVSDYVGAVGEGYEDTLSLVEELCEEYAGKGAGAEFRTVLGARAAPARPVKPPVPVAPVEPKPAPPKPEEEEPVQPSNPEPAGPEEPTKPVPPEEPPAPEPAEPEDLGKGPKFEPVLWGTAAKFLVLLFVAYSGVSLDEAAQQDLATMLAEMLPELATALVAYVGIWLAERQSVKPMVKIDRRG